MARQDPMEPLWLSRRSVIVLSVALAVLAAGLGGFAIGRELGFEDATKGRRATEALATKGPSSSVGVMHGSGNVITSPRPNCSQANDSVRVSQTQSDGPLAVQWFEHMQAAAQTFLVPVSGVVLEEVAIRFQYATGRGAKLRIYEVTDPQDPTFGPELASLELDARSIPSGMPTRVQFTPAFPLRCGQLYSVVIEPIGRSSSMGVWATAFTQRGNVYSDGAMFLGRKRHWQDTGGDMTFEVTMAPATF